MNDLIEQLLVDERSATRKVMAFMSYNPSIGRVLQKGGLSRFQEMVLSEVPKLQRIRDREDFDNFHNEWINNFMRNIRRNNGQKCSYGQAQKAINVFLKVFVYWSQLPDRSIANRITPFLHVPLDRILMRFVKKEFPDEFKKKIRPSYHNRFDYSLTLIEEEIYRAWQKWFRDLHPNKPILLDVIWAVNRE